MWRQRHQDQLLLLWREADEALCYLVCGVRGDLYNQCGCVDLSMAAPAFQACKIVVATGALPLQRDVISRFSPTAALSLEASTGLCNSSASKLNCQFLLSSAAVNNINCTEPAGPSITEGGWVGSKEIRSFGNGVGDTHF